MDNYLKYLTSNQEDKNWGLYLTVVGIDNVIPGPDYPKPGKTKGYYHFEWDEGRMMSEYQINYITEGEGILETITDTYPIKEGSIILVRPHQWHRYRPIQGTGWVEHFVGFKGECAEKIVENNRLLTKSPVVFVGYQDDILNNILSILNYVKYEKSGFQQVCAGLVTHILGQIVWSIKNQLMWDTSIEGIIQKACLILRDNVHLTLKIEELSKVLDVNYSLFRRAFKNYTGLSPNQYHLSLRMDEASYLLVNTKKSIGQISTEMGFCNTFYFSKIFKEKTGKTPTQFRNENKIV